MSSPSPASKYGDLAGGITTFFTMAYIVIVNPGILSTPGTGMSFAGAMTATVLIACSMTLLMGMYAKLPFAVAHDPAGEVQKKFQAVGVPETYLVSGDGRLLWVRRGGLAGAGPEVEAGLDSAVQKLAAAAPTG